MASEDVLERAERLLAKCPGYELPPYTDTLIVEDLAAEVRELRKEREQYRARLLWCVRHEAGIAGDDEVHLMFNGGHAVVGDQEGCLEDAIDAAMTNKEYTNDRYRS